MIDTALLGNANGVVRASIIDDEPFDRVEPRYAPRQFGKRERESPCLVQARDLNDELHQIHPPTIDVLPSSALAARTMVRTPPSR